MFGMTKPKSKFGLMMPGTMGSPYGTPPFAPPTQRMAEDGAAAPSPAKKRGGLFGSGIQLRDVIGIAGDAVAINRGMAPIFAGQEHERELERMKAEQQELQRQAEYEDFVRREQWKRDNPSPVNNDTVADYEFIRQRLGESEAQKYLKNKASPPLWRQGPDGQFYPMATPGADAPDTLPADFDFGDGGPQAGPAATFPRR